MQQAVALLQLQLEQIQAHQHEVLMHLGSLGPEGRHIANHAAAAARVVESRVEPTSRLWRRQRQATRTKAASARARRRPDGRGAAHGGEAASSLRCREAPSCRT